jgi:hypothetical protein
MSVIQQEVNLAPLIFTASVALLLGGFVIFDEELKRLWPWWRD